MTKKFGYISKQRGQGIVEYALLLAFIIGLALIMQSSDFGGAIGGTFNRVAQALGMETEHDKWSTMSASDLRNVPNEKRMAADKEFLTNIGKHFIGMNKDDVKKLLNTSNTSNVLLGHFVEDVDGNGNLVTSFDTNTTNASTGELYNWATGAAEGTKYDTSKRYLFSDYALDNAGNVYGGLKTGNGIKIMKIEYDSNNQVSRVDLAVNPNSGVGNIDDLKVTVTK